MHRKMRGDTSVGSRYRPCGTKDWNNILSLLMEKQLPPVSAKAERSAFNFVFSRWMVVAAALAVVLPWLAIIALLTSGRWVPRGSAPAIGKAQEDAATRSASDESKAIQPDVVASAQTESAATPADPVPQEWTGGKKGPGGQVESMLFAIDVQDEFV